MKVVFGDNQFLAVNHSGEKRRSYEALFSRDKEVSDTLDHAWQAGIRDFAFTVTSRMTRILQDVVNSDNFELHPAVPYAQEINNKLTSGGFTGLAADVLSHASLVDLFVGGVQSLAHDYRRIFKVYLDVELSKFDMNRVGSIGLLNVATDFLLGIGRIDIIDQFCSVVRERYGKIPVLYTMNFVKLSDAIWEEDKYNTRLIFNLNENGFRVNPSLDAVVDAIRRHSGRDMYVMSVFSGLGASPAPEFLRNFPELGGVLFGSSNPDRVRSNFKSLSSV